MNPEEKKALSELTDEDIANQIAADPDVAPIQGEEFFVNGEIISPSDPAPPQPRVQAMVRLDSRVHDFFMMPNGRTDNDRINQVLNAWIDNQGDGTE